MKDYEHPDITKYCRDGYISAPPESCCPGCDSGIGPGATVYEIDGELFCEECFKDYVRDYLADNPHRLADVLDVIHFSYGEGA